MINVCLQRGGPRRWVSTFRFAEDGGQLKHRRSSLSVTACSSEFEVAASQSKPNGAELVVLVRLKLYISGVRSPLPPQRALAAAARDELPPQGALAEAARDEATPGAEEALDVTSCDISVT